MRFSGMRGTRSRSAFSIEPAQIRWIGVLTEPEARQLTRIRSGASSKASERDRYSTAAFVIPYNEFPGLTTLPTVELTLTTAAQSERRSAGSEACTRRKIARTFVAR